MRTRIFWVEDALEMMGGLIRILERRNFDVTAVRTAREVYSRVDEVLKSELIMVDLLIPTGDNESESEGELNGNSIIKWIRQDLKSDIPILVFTYATDHTEFKNFEKCKILRKPASKDQILTAIENCLNTT